jgi:potassium-transporting ATPase ATP-binding subunit
METSTLHKSIPVSALFDPKIVLPAICSAFVKFNPRTLIRKPVMFVLEIVTALTTLILVRDLVIGEEHIGFEFQIILWLWLTVLFANFSEAIAEGRGKAQADSLRRQRTETQAKLDYRLCPSGKPILPAFRRSARIVRFIAFEILVTGVFAFE